MDQITPVLGPFWAQFSIRGHNPDPLGSAQTSKMVDFDRKYLKVPFPHFLKRRLAAYCSERHPGSGRRRPKKFHRNPKFYGFARIKLF